MASEGGYANSGEYIEHHLQNLQGCFVDGQWTTNIHETKICAGNFWALNLDSMFWSVFLGILFSATLFYRVAKNIEAGKPGKMQAWSRWSSSLSTAPSKTPSTARAR